MVNTPLFNYSLFKFISCAQRDKEKTIWRPAEVMRWSRVRSPPLLPARYRRRWHRLSRTGCSRQWWAQREPVPDWRRRCADEAIWCWADVHQCRRSWQRPLAGRRIVGEAVWLYSYHSHLARRAPPSGLCLLTGLGRLGSIDNSDESHQRIRSSNTSFYHLELFTFIQGIYSR